MGLAGCRGGRLTLPPFVPSRVVFERTFERQSDVDLYRLAKEQHVFHVAQRSSQNLRRYVDELAPRAVIVWISGKSAANGRGAILAHTPAEGFHWAWYVGLAAEQDWGLSTHRGISPVEFRHLQKAGMDASLLKRG